jgi:hypothetical protein
MEIISSQEYALDREDAGAFLFASDDRPVGVHLSQVLHGIEQATGKRRDSKRIEDMDKRERAEFFARTEMGFIWEEMASRYFKPRMLLRRSAEVRDYEPQPSCWHDGIWLTPDGIDCDEDPCVLDEFKATTMSIGRMFRALQNGPEGIETEFWRWCAQIKGYLRATGLVRARLFVLWMVGDWAGSGPRVTTHLLEWTEEEINANWRMVTESAKGMGLIR